MKEPRSLLLGDNDPPMSTGRDDAKLVKPDSPDKQEYSEFEFKSVPGVKLTQEFRIRHTILEHVMTCTVCKGTGLSTYIHLGLHGTYRCEECGGTGEVVV